MVCGGADNHTFRNIRRKKRKTFPMAKQKGGGASDDVMTYETEVQLAITDKQNELEDIERVDYLVDDVIKE